MLARGPFQMSDTHQFLALKAALEDVVLGLQSYAAHMERLRELSKSSSLGVLLVDLTAEFPEAPLESCMEAMAQDLKTFWKSKVPDGLTALRGVHGDQFLLFLGPDSLAATPMATLTHLGQDVEHFLSNLSEPGITVRLGLSLTHFHASMRFERQIHQAVDDAFHQALTQADVDGRLRILGIAQIVQNRQIRSLYHPVVNMETGRVLGYEALARGPKGTRYEAPDFLFGSVRNHPLAYELDRLAKQCAMKGAKDMPSDKILFMNTLPFTIRDPNTSGEKLQKSLEEVGLSTDRLVIELTEREAISDYEALGESIAPYREMGIRWAVDDVGTGYSSLQTISEIKPHYLKVDISLVQGVDTNLIQQELVSSLVGLARNIGAVLIAEGLNTIAERTTLMDLGIRLGQGFLYGRPAAHFPLEVTI